VFSTSVGLDFDAHPPISTDTRDAVQSQLLLCRIIIVVSSSGLWQLQSQPWHYIIQVHLQGATL